VWIVKFSRTGEKLASLCKDGSLCVWKLAHKALTFEVTCLLEISTKLAQVVCINWSQASDDYLLTAGKEKAISVWSAKSG
jgi:WD40 repeat protein